MKKIRDFKCRASMTGVLQAGYQSINKIGIQRISDLENERDFGVNANGNKVKWTQTKLEEYNKLVNLRANPKLGSTYISFLKEWLIEELTGTRIDVKSKYLTHGIDTEHLALIRAGKYFNCEFPKNEIQLENDYFTGTFDSRNDDMVIDVKSSFTSQTFPYFVDFAPNNYYSQLQTYMDLTGLKKSALVFCLEDGTDEEIERLAWDLAKEEAKENDLDDVEMDMTHWNTAKERLSYGHLPEWMRIKVFKFDLNERFNDENKQRVLDGRRVIENVLLPFFADLKSNFTNK